MSRPTRKQWIRLGAPLVRVKLRMKPVQPVEGPITQGPLIRLGYPLQRVKLEMKPCRPHLVLSFSLDSALGLTAEGLCSKVVPLLNLVAGGGFAYEQVTSSIEPERVTFDLVPMSREAEGMLPELKKALPPALAVVAAAWKPEVTEYPVSET